MFPNKWPKAQQDTLCKILPTSASATTLPGMYVYEETYYCPVDGIATIELGYRVIPTWQCVYCGSAQDYKHTSCSQCGGTRGDGKI